MTGRRRKRKPRPALPAPKASARLYLRLDPSRLALFKFLLEGWDNLGVLSVVDKHAAVAQLMYSPHQRGDVERFLAAASTAVEFRRLDTPPAEPS